MNLNVEVLFQEVNQLEIKRPVNQVVDGKPVKPEELSLISSNKVLWIGVSVLDSHMPDHYEI